MTRVGTTSVTVTVRIVREDPLSGEQELAIQGELVMVAVDAGMRPVKVLPADQGGP